MIRLTLTSAELEALARGETPPSVAHKAAAKLEAPQPMPGQLDLVEELAKEDA